MPASPSTSLRHAAPVLCAVAGLMLSGCVATTTSSTVLNNRPEYLKSNFTLDALPSDLKAQVSKLTVPYTPRFKTLNLVGDMSIKDDGKAVDHKFKLSYVSLGGGLLQEQWEYANNGVPYRMNTSLSYAGLINLRSQTLFLNRSTTEPLLERRAVTQLDPGLLKPVKGQTYALGAAWMDGSKTSEVCTAGEGGLASTLHPALQGETVALSCESRNVNGLVSGRQERAWLADYGVALLISVTTSSRVGTATYVQATAE